MSELAPGPPEEPTSRRAQGSADRFESRDRKFGRAVDRHRRTIVAVATIVTLIVGVLGIRAATSGDRGLRDDVHATGGDDGTTSDPISSGAGAGDGGDTGASATSAIDGTSAADARSRTAKGAGRGDSTASAGDGGGATSANAGPSGGGATTSGGTPLPGVTADEVTVVYYWKGDRTRTSPYLAGSGVEGSVDEAEAFRNLVAFVNANASGGGATLMGYPINLHGRKIKGIVVEAGQDAESYAATAERITSEIKPFAAVAAHGSISAYLCPALAKAGIHNLATYDLAGAQAASTNGYCTPAGMTWEQQVDLSEGYLLRHQRQNDGRVFGVIYAEYPGLVDSAPRMVERYRRAGLNIAAVASVSASLTTAQQQAPNVVARMRAANVNTIVMPDAGAPINFTHSAQSQGYNPDYFIWPCSGQDTMGMVRLFNGAQWARADGLTCYDEAFSSDLTNDDAMRGTEWYAAYKSAAPRAEPPAPTPFVYAALLPLVAGLEGAGRDLTLETFRAGLDRFRPYRYDAVHGRTDDPTNMLLGLGNPDRRLISDAIRLKYNATRRSPGSSAPGAYDYPEKRRYLTRSAFAG